MHAWYCPSWNGDLRLEPDPKDDERTILSIVNPTAREREVLKALGGIFVEKGWLGDGVDVTKVSMLTGRKKLTLSAPLTDVGPVVARVFRPGPAVITAVKFKDGHIETCEHATAGTGEGPFRETPADKEKAAEKSGAHKKPKADKLDALAKKPDATAAATVSRPTPSCPDCYVDACGQATDVLLAFLSAEQHETWARDRFIVCHGGFSKHAYRIAHRHSPIARAQTRICFDLDDQCIVHFHDWGVPPEEEVLASMLILEHHEEWLRNEATLFHNHAAELVFKNPFGDITDGVEDAALLRLAGEALYALRPELVGARP